MSCRRAFEIDLAGFLAEPQGQALAGFRDHYPRCRECSAEVRAWTELDLQLRARAASGAAHPAPELLARYEGSPRALEPREREGVERHLAQCPACRDELRTLRAYAPDGVRGASPAASPGRRLRERLAPLGRIAWHPGFAYALLALILLPTVYATVESRTPTRFAAAPSAGEAAGDRAAVLQEAELRSADEAIAFSEPHREKREFDETPLRPVAPRSEAGAQREVASLAVEPPAAGKRSAAAAEPFAPMAAAVSDRASAGRVLPAIRLQPDHTVEVPASEIGGGLRLWVPLSANRLEPGVREVRVRVSDPSGRRELSERLAAEPGAAEVEVTVPAGWLAPGLYRVELRPAAGAAGDAVVATYALRVRGSLP